MIAMIEDITLTHYKIKMGSQYLQDRGEVGRRVLRVGRQQEGSLELLIDLDRRVGLAIEEAEVALGLTTHIFQRRVAPCEFPY